MTIPAFHVEAKLHGFRRTAEGVVVSFVVSPIDMPHQLATDPLGTRYHLGICEIGDDEQPSRREAPAAERPGVEKDSGAAQTARARASQFAKERYHEASPMVQARTRASLLAKDERFQAWAHEQSRGAADFGIATYTEEGAADFIRASCCEGVSRKLIAEDPEAYRKFLALETMFRMAVGELPEIRS